MEEGKGEQTEGHDNAGMPHTQTKCTTTSSTPSITYPYVPSPIVSVRLKLLIVRVPHGAVEEGEVVKSCDDETPLSPSSLLPQPPPATGPPAMILCVPHASWSGVCVSGKGRCGCSLCVR